MTLDFNTTDSKALQVFATSVFFFIVTPLFIAFRFWSRVTRRSGLGWDDMTVIISFVSLSLVCFKETILIINQSCAVAVQTLLMVACNYGFGQHIEKLTTTNKMIALKVSNSIPNIHQTRL